MIRESCRTSETLNRLSADGERLFWRLTTVADDFGRFEADPRVMLAACFPLKVGVLKVEAVAKWFRELVACSLVQTYVSGCKQLGFFVTWEKHQYVRAKASKYPEPTPDSICSHTPTDSPVVTERLVVTETTEHHESRASGASPVARVEFQIPDSIKAALERCPRLASAPKLMTPRWWQAQVRANRGVDFAQAVLGAEAWLVTNTDRPKKDLPRFLHNWLAEAYRRLHA
jgi:hypothetical protein